MAAALRLRLADVPMADAPPPPTAPRAGGSILEPRRGPPSADEWEWELSTRVERKRVPSAGGRRAEVMVTHTGGCHCGAVRFAARAPADLVVYDCNCSDCRMRRNAHFVVPAGALELICDVRGGSEQPPLAEYRWATGVARHLFCARCGISPFYRPRSNPDGWAVTFACLDAGSVAAVEVRTFDGVHWEECIDGDGASIRDFSRGS